MITLDPKWKWKAADVRGALYLFTDKPTRTGSSWGVIGDIGHKWVCVGDIMPEYRGSWKDSLEELVDGEWVSHVQNDLKERAYEILCVIPNVTGIVKGMLGREIIEVLRQQDKRGDSQ